MKRIVSLDYSYVFSPTAVPPTLQLEIPDFDERLLYTVVNLKTNAPIYGAGSPGLGWSAINSGNILTLQASINGMASTDPLLILYDDYYLSTAAGQIQLAIGGNLVSSTHRLPVEVDAQSAGLGLDSSLQSLISLLGAIGSGVPTLPGGSTSLLGLLRYIASLYPVNSGVPWLSAPAVANPSATFARPANTTQYAVGNLIANSTVAGSVTPMAFTVARAVGGSGRIYRARLVKSTTSLTNAAFCLRLFGTGPTVSNGDGGAYAANQSATFLGKFYITMDETFTDGAMGIGGPAIGDHIDFVVGNSQQTVLGLLTATAAYTPGSAEIFTATLEVGDSN